jgi:large subunit ribosomal protein L17
MRHRKRTIKLGRKSKHREAMLSNMVCSLILEKRIKTTISKAKAARILAERMVTIGKRGKDDVAARRLALSRLHQPEAARQLFTTIAPAFQSREGGYTRILKLGKRKSDASEMVYLEWVDLVAVSAPEVTAEAGA